MKVTVTGSKDSVVEVTRVAGCPAVAGKPFKVVAVHVDVGPAAPKHFLAYVNAIAPVDVEQRTSVAIDLVLRRIRDQDHIAALGKLLHAGARLLTPAFDWLCIFRRIDAY